MNGDGQSNADDPDVDGDGADNGSDSDDDGDGVLDLDDPSPGGCSGECCGENPPACCEVNCDDGNSCTQDGCDPATDRCTHEDRANCAECLVGFCEDGGCEVASCSFAIEPVAACPGSSVELAVVGSCHPDCGSMGFQQTKSVPYLAINPPGSIPCDGQYHERAMTVEVANDAPAGTLFFELEGTHGPVTCYDIGAVEVEQITATLSAIPSAVSASSAWGGLPGAASISDITVMWNPPECEGRLAIVEVQPQGDYEPPDGGTLYRIDANHREYEAFDEPQSALCAKPVKVWIAALQGDMELARVSVLVLPVHTYLTTGATTNLAMDYNYTYWKHAGVLGTTGGVFTSVVIATTPAVTCGIGGPTGYACTSIGGHVEFGTSTFAGTENQAASIIGHELVHAALSNQGGECPAYQWEADHRFQTGCYPCDQAYIRTVQDYLFDNSCP